MAVIRRPFWIAATLALAAGVGLAGVRAQQTLDRTKIPPAGRAPVLHVPAWTQATLDNGATLAVSEKHDLPLVSFTITFQGGADQFETADTRGLASLTAAMMSEGTPSHDGDALSSALQLLGTNLIISIGGESGSIGFQSTTANFGKTLDLLADVLEHPAFPPAALERLRAQRLVALAQAKVQPGSMAARVFPRILYGPTHPFGEPTTEETTKAITRDDVVAFHRRYFQPAAALVGVVGDVHASAARGTIQTALAGWPRGGSAPSFAYPALPAPKPTTIYLVDKPEAAQSTMWIGNPGPPRSTPDFYALQVMNTILGGMFQSRLNRDIREEKGYSYGVSSTFAFGKGPGAFRAYGDIVSAKSDLALIEFMKELRGIAGAKPVTDAELKTAKDDLIQRLPGQFASVAGINAAITSIWLQGLPQTYYQDYGAHIAAVTHADVLRVAKKYIDLDHLAIVIVGDRATIEAPLKATAIAPLVVVDLDGVVQK